MTYRSFQVPAPRQWGQPAEEPFSAYERRNKLIRLGVLALVVLIVAAVLGALVWQAHANYVAGQRALAAGAYGAAIDRLNAAKVAGFAYANSRALLDRAIALSQQETGQAAVVSGEPRASAATRRLARAAELFAAGNYTQALALVPAGLSGRYPPAALALRTADGGSGLVGLLLLVQARTAFASGAWQVAASDARGVLARAPHCTPAADLVARAERAARAQPYVARARALASAGHWRAAQREARLALHIDPAYPGAAALLSHITANIPRKKPKPAATTSPSPAPAATTPPAPSTPAPTPKPPAPPPP